MKKLLSLSLSVIAIGLLSSLQSGHTLPDVKVKNLDGETVSTSEFSNDGKPMIISFWATWCKPCLRELSAIKDYYPFWQEETGVKLIAVSIDDARNSRKVKPYVLSESWEYDVYLDENSTFRRAMNVNNVPHTFLLDGDGKIVWQHTSYSSGDEDVLYELVLKLSRGEKIDD